MAARWRALSSGSRKLAVNELRWRIVVITNQSGIGRGYYDEAAYQQLTRWMCERFEAENAKITRVYHCPYHPEHGIGEYRLDHPWRKPKPGMIVQAALDLDIDLARSAIIGDTLADIAAGAEAGIGLRIRVGPGDVGRDAPPHDLVASLADALALLRSRLAPD